MKTITIECPSCNGTGVYSGIGEDKGVAVICHTCKGEGHTTYSYTEFTGRKVDDSIKRVYLSGYGYKIGLGTINFNGIGKIDMYKEGVSYQDFLKGDRPKHIETLVCPMLADQGNCHDKEGFTTECNILNDGWISNITKCKMQPNKAESLGAF